MLVVLFTQDSKAKDLSCGAFSCSTGVRLHLLVSNFSRQKWIVMSCNISYHCSKTLPTVSGVVGWCDGAG